MSKARTPVDENPAYRLFAEIQEPRNTRERILFAATDLFYLHGINAVGLDQIMDAAKLTKTTFYNHFACLDDLIEEAIQLRDQWESHAFARALQEKAGYDPRAMLLAMFDVLQDWFTAPEYKGCLFLMAVIEYPHAAHPAHKAGASHYLVTRGQIEQMAAAAGVKDPAFLARQWCVLLVGTVAQHLIDPAQQPALAAKKAAEVLLTAELGGAATHPA